MRLEVLMKCEENAHLCKICYSFIQQGFINVERERNQPSPHTHQRMPGMRPCPRRRNAPQWTCWRSEWTPTAGRTCGTSDPLTWWRLTTWEDSSALYYTNKAFYVSKCWSAWPVICQYNYTVLPSRSMSSQYQPWISNREEVSQAWSVCPLIIGRRKAL